MFPVFQSLKKCLQVSVFANPVSEFVPHKLTIHLSFLPHVATHPYYNLLSKTSSLIDFRSYKRYVDGKRKKTYWEESMLE